jgi:hypothetical protein
MGSISRPLAERPPIEAVMSMGTLKIAFSTKIKSLRDPQQLGNAIFFGSCGIPGGWPLLPSPEL